MRILGIEFGSWSVKAVEMESRFRRFDVFGELARGPVRGQDSDVVADAELVERRHGLLDDFEIGIAPHQDGHIGHRLTRKRTCREG